MVTPGGPAARVVLLSGVLDGAAASEAGARLVALDAEAVAPVSLVVNSGGGPLGDVAGLLDVLHLVRSPVEVAAMGRAHGTAGVLVAAAPGRRLGGPRATVSLRCAAVPATGGAAGPTDAGRGATELAAVRDALVARLAERTGRAPRWLAEQLERGGVLRAGAAVTAGLLDAVVGGG